jgi:hypothetical protein
VRLGQVAADRQSETEPAVLSARRTIGLAESLEHVRQALRIDPFAGVGAFPNCAAAGGTP